MLLAIETSCDDTAAAVLEGRKVLSNCIANQNVIHKTYGGVVPEIASREHEKMLNNITIKALKYASIDLNQVQGIAVTNGPGLAGSLLTGVSFAKGLALGLGIKIISINHLEAHIIANLLEDPDIQFPFLCLLVSGGHTQLWLINDCLLYTSDAADE